MKTKIAAAIVAGFAMATAGVPATAVGPDAQIFYAGCDLFAAEPSDRGGHFATSFISPYAASRSILFRKLGTDGFEDTSPVPANVREARDLVTTSNGTWQVVIRLHSDTGPILRQKTQYVDCPDQ